VPGDGTDRVGVRDVTTDPVLGEDPDWVIVAGVFVVKDCTPDQRCAPNPSKTDTFQ
jgi:hypothetical protein